MRAPIPTPISRRRASERARRPTARLAGPPNHTDLTLPTLTTQVGVLLAASVAVRAASQVVVLDDQNFEHLTQAATGATTGDWFVAFKAPWCVGVRTDRLRSWGCLGCVDWVGWKRLTSVDD